MTEKNSSKKVYLCPKCSIPVELPSRNKYFPFCSERCKMIDLGAWLENRYAIPTAEQADEDVVFPDDEQ